MTKYIRLVAIVLCLFVMAFAVSQLWPMLIEYKTGDNTYESLQRYAAIPDANAEETEEAESETAETSGEPEEEPSEEETDENAPDYSNIVWPEVDFDSLYLTNSDIVGWVYQEGTAINYPIVQGVDNDHYLHYLFDGTYNAMGSIFLDYRNSSDFSDVNCILYGHHMKNGSMFQSISGYKKQSYYDEHPNLLLITPEHRYVVELFAGYVIEPRGDAWQVVFDNIGEYREWLQNAQAKSTFQSDYTPTEYDQILTLSTCSYEFSDARYVVVGVMNEVD